MNHKNLKNFFILTIFINISLYSFSQQIVKIQINSSPSGAAVYTEQKHLGVTPCEINLRIGVIYDLSFSKDGYPTKTISYKCDGNPINVTLVQPSPVIIKVQVNSNPNGATIYTNQKQLGVTPCSINLRQGQMYKLEFFKSGYNTYSIDYICDGNPINVTLAGNSQRLSVNSNINGATVYINNSQYGQTPLTTTLNQGNYNIVVKYPGYRDFATSINLNSDQSVYANLESDRFINIKLPSGANIYINGQRQQLNWGRDDRDNRRDNDRRHDRDDRDRDRDNGNWKTFTFTSASDTANVRIEYYDIIVEKTVRFDRGTLVFTGDLIFR